MSVDRARFLSRYIDNSAGVNAVIAKLELPTLGRIYTVQLAATGLVGDGQVVLHLSDSEITVRQGHDLRAVLPGLLFSSFAQLEVPAGATASLYLAYGECKT